MSEPPTKIKIKGSGALVKSDATSSTGSMSALTGSPVSTNSCQPQRSTRNRKLRGWQQPQKTPAPAVSRETFKGVNEAIKGKFFTIGPDQVSRYDDALKALIGYLSSKYDHRVSLCIQYKDKIVGVQLLTKHVAPMKTDPDNNSKKGPW